MPVEDLQSDDLDLERVAFDTTREGFDLLRAASLLPRVEGRVPDTDAVVRTVDGWAAEVRREVEQRSSWQGPLHGLVTVLFSRVRLRDDVLQEGVAGRVVLLLVVETARRAGLIACGLALPRHFMAGVMLRRPDVPVADDVGEGADLFFIDAFHAQVLPPEDVAARAGLPLDELAEHLAPAPPDVILLRMLTNLRGSYLRRQDAPSCLRVLSRLLLLKPREAALHLERAHLRHALGDDDGALVDAENGLKLAKDPEEQDVAERILEKLMKSSGWVQ